MPFDLENDEDLLSIGNVKLNSRLLMGTSRYPNPEVMLRSLAAGGAELVTVSIRRINPTQKFDSFLSELSNYRLLPNTAGCYTAHDAVLTARLAREALETNWIKVEVIGDDFTLLPDAVELLAACKTLVSEGFVVLPYCPDDPILCKRLEDIGCSAVMPLAAPIGSGQGVRNPYNLELIRKFVKIPVIVDAGIGAPSDAALALELGCDAVLLNTAVAEAESPVRMALAFRLAVQAGRLARLAGRIPKIAHANASSPKFGIINQ